MCLSVTTFSATARNNAPNKIYQRLQSFKNGVFCLKQCFVQKLWRHLLTAKARAHSLTAQGHKVVQKPNRALNAWNKLMQCSELRWAVYSSLLSVYFPVTGFNVKRHNYTHALTRTRIVYALSLAEST